MAETAFEVGQEVFILCVMGHPIPHLDVGTVTIEKIDPDGIVWVSIPNGHKCPWRRVPDEVFLTRPEAEEALQAWQDSFPSIADIFGSAEEVPDAR